MILAWSKFLSFHIKEIKMAKKFTVKQIKQKLNTSGYKRDPVDRRDYKYRNTIRFESLDELRDIYLSFPPVIDHSSEMSSIKDQGQLGSCVGFAVTAMKEWQEQQEHLQELTDGKTYKRKEEHYDLSEAWVYWNSKKIDPWPGEEGTSIRYAMKVLNKIGVPTEKAWPYDDIDFGNPARWAAMVAKWSLINSYWSIENVYELKAALAKSPIPIGIGCYREIFYVGSDGIIPYPANPNDCYGGHAVCAVGYDDSRSLVKFKNSWSPYWGEDGYGYINYDYVRDFMWDAWASEDLSVTREMLKGKRSLI